jgi:RimJ/RimL family protein N-acetyltransferase
MRTLQAGGLTLEPQTAAHAPEMFVLLSDPVLCEYLDSGPPSDVAWLTERFSRLETRRSGDGLEHWLNWVLRVPGQGLVGFVQATVHADGSAHVAYELGRAFWGRGWATQATSAMVQELADHYAVQSAFATVDKRNVRSIRVLERLGFTVASADSGSPHGAAEGDWLYRRDPLFAAPTAAP